MLHARKACNAQLLNSPYKDTSRLPGNALHGSGFYHRYNPRADPSIEVSIFVPMVLRISVVNVDLYEESYEYERPMTMKGITGSDLMTMEFPPQNFIVEGLIPRRD